MQQQVSCPWGSVPDVWWPFTFRFAFSVLRRDPFRIYWEVAHHERAACRRVIWLDFRQMSQVRFEYSYPDIIADLAVARPDYRRTA